MQFSVTIYQDTRRATKDGTYAVKLRVWCTRTRTAQHYRLGMRMTEKEFDRTWNTDKPRADVKERRMELDAHKVKAEDIAKELDPFSFEAFDRNYRRKTSDADNVYWHYEQMISTLRERKQLGNASNYELSRKSIQAFITTLGRTGDRLTFYEITPAFLEKYEAYMVGAGKSRTTVSMYLRALRAIFNEAIAKEDIKKDLYPFGKRKYQVPAVKKVKKALSAAELRKLWEAGPANPEQEKAKDFWFFSYNANGMNMKDIALLRHKDLHVDKLVFYRAKTINTSKADSRPITVYLNAYLNDMLTKHRTVRKSSESLVFPIVNEQDTLERQRATIQNFTRFVNQHMKVLAKANGITGDISTYWARHSFATISVVKGASLAFVQESLGHGNIKTTMGYIGGFGEESKKEFAATLMDF